MNRLFRSTAPKALDYAALTLFALIYGGAIFLLFAH